MDRAARFHIPWERLLLLTVDLALAGVIFIAPLFLGGRHPLGRFVLVTLACTAAVAWVLRQTMLRRAHLTLSGAEPLLLLGLALIGLQLMPLPTGWLSRLSPVPDMLPLWNSAGDSGASLGCWSTLTVTPDATRVGFCVFVAYALLFLVVLAHIRRVEDVERLLTWIALGATSMAVLGLAQYLAGNGKFFWFYEHPFRDTDHAARGAFINPNHFAHFLALGVGPLIWWVQRMLRGRRRKEKADFEFSAEGGRRKHLGTAVSVGCWALVMFAALLSYSRGGVAIVVLAAAVCLVVYWRWALLDRKAFIGLGVVSLLMMTGLWIHGKTQLSAQMETISGAESFEQFSGGREELWKALSVAVPDFAALGSGVGSHRDVYPMYLSKYYPTEFTHAECGYLQVLLETGVPGLALLLLGIGICLFWWLRTFATTPSTRIAACSGAIAAAVSASLLHSLVDFVWYIPACMSVTVLMVACLWRLYELSRRMRGVKRVALELPRGAWLAATAVVTLVSVALMGYLWPAAAGSRHWDAYLARSLETKYLDPSDPDWADALGPRMTHVTRLLEADPKHGRGNLRMASLCLLCFELRQVQAENAMPLIHVRDAASASGFADQQALDEWLDAALGENVGLLRRALYHTRLGLAGCPLQGEGYLNLADLSFLEMDGGPSEPDLLEQALRVRPHSGAVQFAAGREAAFAGDVERAVALWKPCFNHDPLVRAQIIGTFGESMPPEFFLEKLEPDTPALLALFRYYHLSGFVPAAEQVGPLLATRLVAEAKTADTEQAAELWRQACQTYQRLRDHERAVICGREAVRLAPKEYAVRRSLASSLFQAEQYDEAIKQLKWCLHRNGDDPQLRDALRLATRHSLDGTIPKVGADVDETAAQPR